MFHGEGCSSVRMVLQHYNVPVAGNSHFYSPYTYPSPDPPSPFFFPDSHPPPGPDRRHHRRGAAAAAEARLRPAPPPPLGLHRRGPAALQRPVAAPSPGSYRPAVAVAPSPGPYRLGGAVAWLRPARRGPRQVAAPSPGQGLWRLRLRAPTGLLTCPNGTDAHGLSLHPLPCPYSTDGTAESGF